MGERGAANASPTEAEIVDDGQARREGAARRRARVHHLAHADPQEQRRRTVPDPTPTSPSCWHRRGDRRVGRGVLEFAPNQSAPMTGVALMSKVAALRSADLVSLNQADRRRKVARGPRLLADARMPTYRSSPSRRPRRRPPLRPASFVHPLLFHPAYRAIATPRWPTTGRADRPGAAPPLVEDVPDDGGFLPPRCSTSLTASIRSTVPTSTTNPIGTDRCRPARSRRDHAPMALVLDQLTSADRRNGMSTRRSSTTATATSPCRTRRTVTHDTHGAQRRRRSLRRICDGGTPTFMLTHWTRDRVHGPQAAPRARRAPPDRSRPLRSTA